MTQLLHTTGPAGGGADAEFSGRRQLGEVDTIISSHAGRTYLAECYTGWPGTL